MSLFILMLQRLLPERYIEKDTDKIFSMARDPRSNYAFKCTYGNNIVLSRRVLQALHTA